MGYWQLKTLGTTDLSNLPFVYDLTKPLSGYKISRSLPTKYEHTKTAYRFLLSMVIHFSKVDISVRKKLFPT